MDSDSRSPVGSHGRGGRPTTGPRRRLPRLFDVAAAAAVAIVSAPARAGIPPLHLAWSVDDVGFYDDDPAGIQNGDRFIYSGVLIEPYGLSLQYTIVADTSEFLSVGYALLNNTASTIDVLITATMPEFSFPRGAELSGSSAVSFTSDGAGGAIQSPPAAPLWQGFVDGAAIGGASMFVGLDLNDIDLGSQAADDAFDGVAVASITDSLGIDVEFSLSPGDQFSITSVFRVPTPGGLALVAVAAFLSRPSRRRQEPLQGSAASFRA